MLLFVNHETKLDPGSPSVRQANKVDTRQKVSHPLASSPLPSAAGRNLSLGR